MTMAWNKKIRQEARKNRFKGGVILGLTVFLSLSFWSYNPQDPSLNFFGLSRKVTNYCGFIGASLADLFYQLFGFSSWFFILGGILLSYKFFTNRFRESLLNTFLLFGLFLLAFISLSALHFPDIHFFKQEVSLGGALGKVIVSALTPLFHTTGTAVLLWSALVLVLIFYSHILFSQIFWTAPKKAFISSWLVLKQSPVLISFIAEKSQVIYQPSMALLKKYLTWLKARFQMIKKSLLKNKDSSLKNPEKKSSPAPKKIPISKAPPRFTFKEDVSVSEKVKPASIPLSSSNEESIIEEEQSHLKEEPEPIPEKSFSFSQLPSINTLSDPPNSPEKIARQDVEDLSKKLIDKLAQFSIQGEITAVKTGPALVLFEFKPEDHVKVSRIRGMESDLGLALSSESIRIIAPIPGRDVVGIEASMSYRKTVFLKNLLKEKSFLKADLPLVLGRRADNLIGVKDLARIPHLLVAGTTGSGKSMFIISFITSLLFRHTPETLRLLLIDPKQVDLSSFKGIPHLLSPIITSAHSSVGSLRWAIMEMEKRYRSLSLFKARDHKSFNTIVKDLNFKDKKFHQEKNESLNLKDSYYFEALPLICIVIEEFGDLMADRSVRRAIENSVVRLAQKARASGIHLVLAMQSPRKDVLTGLIKTNIPGRISFKVASGTDSRVILDETGAERLLSHGDMLFLEPGSLKPTRYHGPFVREKDVIEIGNYWRSQGEPLYEESLMSSDKKGAMESSISNGEMNIKEDPMYPEILEFVGTCNVISASYLQRKFRIGYPRAARIIEVLFEEEKIGPPQGSKPREVLINK